MHSLNMLEVIAPGKAVKRYINGRRVPDIRWHLAQAHAAAKECFVTTGKGDKWYNRHIVRSRIDFSK